MASTQLGTLFFFIKHAHSQYLRANSYTLVSWLLVLNGMRDLIKTNLFFFHFFIVNVFAYTRVENILFYETIIPNAWLSSNEC